jgi:hypothetical protein
VSDYYAGGTVGEWELLCDKSGQPIRGLGGCFSSTGREIAFFTESGPDKRSDIFLAQRARLHEPFGNPTRVNPIRGPDRPTWPCFARGDRELYFNQEPAQENRLSLGTIKRTVRRVPGESFGSTLEVPGLPRVTQRCCFSPDGLNVYYISEEKHAICRATRRLSDEPFQEFVTNLTWDPKTTRIGMNPVAATDKGTVLFTWVVEEEVWLAAARTSGSAMGYKTPEKLVKLGLSPLQAPGEKLVQAPALSINPEASLLLGRGPDLAVMPLAESDRRKIRDRLEQAPDGGQASRSPAQTPARKREDKLEDLLQPGTVWKGKFSFVDGKLDGELTITIKTRDGNKFIGVHDANSVRGRYTPEIKGIVKVNYLEYSPTVETKPFKVTGSLYQGVLEMRFLSWDNKLANVKPKLQK